MNTERRKCPRYLLNGVTATLSFNPPLMAPQLYGEVIDMSYTGIKIQLQTPITEQLDGRQICIRLVLPETGIPLSINGVIRYQSASECGLAYLDQVPQDYLDEMIFECTKSLPLKKAVAG